MLSFNCEWRCHQTSHWSDNYTRWLVFKEYFAQILFTNRTISRRTVVAVGPSSSIGHYDSHAYDRPDLPYTCTFGSDLCSSLHQTFSRGQHFLVVHALSSFSVSFLSIKVSSVIGVSVSVTLSRFTFFVSTCNERLPYSYLKTTVFVALTRKRYEIIRFTTPMRTTAR